MSYLSFKKKHFLLHDKYDYCYVSLGDSIAAGHAINNDWSKKPYSPTGYSVDGQTVFYYEGVDSQHGEILFGQTKQNPSTIIVKGTYTDLIRNDLVNLYGENRVSVISFAHSGDTVEDLLEKLELDTLKEAISKANLVTICIGANGVLGPALANIEKYISKGTPALNAIGDDVERNLAILADDNNPKSYKALFDKLYSLNSDAKYIFTTIYNPYKFLAIDEGPEGFFGPMLNLIPDLRIDVDEEIEDRFLDGTDLSYYDLTKSEWVSIELEIDVANVIKQGLLDTSYVQMLFDRISPISSWAEKYVNQLNSVLTQKLSSYPNGNFHLVDAKAVFDTYPDRSEPGDVHYNDLVNVEFTKGYKTSTMDWGNLWDSVGKSREQYWLDLVLEHTHWKFPGVDNLTWNLNDYVNFELEGLVGDLLDQVVKQVIFPDIDPHPEEGGHAVLHQLFTGVMYE